MFSMRSVGDIDDLVMAYPGPAFCCSKDGQDILSNSAAKALGDEAALAAPALAAMRSHEDASATTWRTPFGKGADQRTLEWTAFLVPPDAILALGRDVTMESQLSQVLAESRQRYHDIVELSRDFIWETDTEGRFTFVSPRGGFGYADTELSGQSSSLLLAEDSISESPFTRPLPINGRETWLMRKDGRHSLAALFSHPLMAGEDRITGFRGICRPIGETVEGGGQNPESLLRIAEYVTRPFSAGQDIRNAATLVAGAATRALAAIGVAIGVKDSPGSVPRLAAFSALPSPQIVEKLLRCIGNGESPSLAGGILAAPAWQGGETVGGITAWRENTPFRPEEERLFSAIAERLGPAIATSVQTGELERKSRTDALTGLANRQGFDREAAHRLESGNAFALIFIGIATDPGPLDDDILRSMAAILTGAIRRNDFAARIGNSEFAILVEGSEEAALSNIRKRIMDASGNLAPPTRISLGRAVRREGEPIESLVRRAREDMTDSGKTPSGIKK